MKKEEVKAFYFILKDRIFHYAMENEIYREGTFESVFRAVFIEYLGIKTDTKLEIAHAEKYFIDNIGKFTAGSKAFNHHNSEFKNPYIEKNVLMEYIDEWESTATTDNFFKWSGFYMILMLIIGLGLVLYFISTSSL